MKGVQLTKLAQELNLTNLTPDIDLTEIYVKTAEINRPALQLTGCLLYTSTLSWSSIKMAFQNCRQISGIVKRPKALGDIRGISYIYPLFWKFGLIEVPKETAKKMSGECDTEAEL